MAYLKLGKLVVDVLMVTSFDEASSATFATHNLATGKPTLQAIGDGLSTINLTITLESIVGHNVPGVIEEINNLKTSMIAHKLVFADGLYKGDYIINSMNTVIRKTASNGNVTSATISLSLMESADRQVVSVRKTERNSNQSKRKMYE